MIQIFKMPGANEGFEKPQFERIAEVEETEQEALQRILQKATAHVDNLPDEQLELYQKRENLFRKYLQAKYPEYESYRVYHEVFGSSQEPQYNLFDFPGEDSVEVFLYDPFNPRYEFQVNENNADDLAVRKRDSFEG